ncbi:hypothetical protein NQ314_002815, partial [Rhamnusium bicolor]
QNDSRKPWCEVAPPSQGGGSQGFEMERKYSVPSNPESRAFSGGTASEDLHAWSIYRQNLNSDFTDSALGSTDKSPLPYGNFQLRDTTVQSILSHPRYGPKSALGSNMYTYLKFGLPRVFPPNHNGSNRSNTPQHFTRNASTRPHTRGLKPGSRGPRDGSSGYDSSDNETSNHYKHNRKYRSDPDFRLQNIQQAYHGGSPPGLPLAAMQQGGIRPSNQWNRNKSISEANLLATEYNRSYHNMDPHPHHHLRDPRRNSVAEFGHHHDVVDHRGGEIMAIMATSQEEGTALLDVVAGLKRPVVGNIILNGQNVRSSNLKPRVAYVQSDPHLCKDMTVIQTLRFHYDLKKPTDKLGYLKIDAMDRINVLIEDLGLEQVRNTRVSSMTISERRRLNVACHLLLDTDIVVLDQPTRGMDIFDTFFLVEYLKQWANGGAGHALGRIVIFTMHPPTYEIFTMLSRILLISAGRTMFSGRRRDMLPYFALVDYPCPSYKNPSDYYLDLVTLDDLSAEAMLESSQRIEQLAEIFRQKQQSMSDPGPPSALPMTVKNSNCFVQGFVLFTKAMFYTQPNTFLNWLTLIIISASLSLIIGAIFWDVPNSDSQLILNDRQGYHYSVMCVMAWPLLLFLTVSEIRRNRRTVERDIRDGLYGRLIYIFSKSLINLLPSLFVWLIYIVPSYSMCGLYMQSLYNYDGFYIYIGVMLIYLSCIQIFTMTVIYLLPLTNLAAMVSSAIITAFFLAAGYVLHFKDLPSYYKWLHYVSPTSWLMPFLLNRELSPEAVQSSSATTLCRNKQVTKERNKYVKNENEFYFQVQHQDIIVQLPCPPPNGTNILINYGYSVTEGYVFDYGNTPVAMVAFYFIFFIVTCVAFVMNCCRSNKNSKRKGRNDANKP